MDATTISPGEPAVEEVWDSVTIGGSAAGLSAGLAAGIAMSSRLLGRELSGLFTRFGGEG